MELTITDAQTVLADAYEGCSIAVNGVCLTVVTYDSTCRCLCSGWIVGCDMDAGIAIVLNLRTGEKTLT
jgi:hypothetical protein